LRTTASRDSRKTTSLLLCFACDQPKLRVKNASNNSFYYHRPGPALSLLAFSKLIQTRLGIWDVIPSVFKTSYVFPSETIMRKSRTQHSNNGTIALLSKLCKRCFSYTIWAPVDEHSEMSTKILYYNPFNIIDIDLNA